MQLLPLRVKAAHFTVLAAVACAPTVANPSVVLLLLLLLLPACLHSQQLFVQVHDRAAYAAAVRGLGECVDKLQQLSPVHAAVCQWWHAQALTRAALREPQLYVALFPHCIFVTILPGTHQQRRR
jgi:hypothetical protein